MEFIEPKYYTSYDYQPIDFFIDTFGEPINLFLLSQVIKYVSRFRNKNGSEDLKKAFFYISRIKDSKFDFDSNFVNKFIDQFDNPEYLIFERLINNHTEEAIILLTDLIDEYNN